VSVVCRLLSTGLSGNFLVRKTGAHKGELDFFLTSPTVFVQWAATQDHYDIPSVTQVDPNLESRVIWSPTTFAESGRAIEGNKHENSGLSS